MSFIYLILGIMGWTAAAIVLSLYIWFGKRPAPTAVRSDSSDAARTVDPSDRTAVGVTRN